MKKHILMMLVIACLPTIALAAPDFSGSWVRDNDKSDTVPYPLYWLTRGVDPGGRANGEFVMTVLQNAHSVQVTDTQHPLRTYELDGMAHSVATDTGLEMASVTASLKGDTLVVGITQPYGGMPGNVTMNVEEAWSLSANGKVLTITTTRDVPAAKQTSKQIFSRK
jgi:hypothetical protein